jgi:hypothetical protein
MSTNEKTAREVYGPAMKITNQEEADRLFTALVDDFCERYPEKTRAQHEDVQRGNLAYYAGYYNHETRARVEQLFHCKHPVFGAIAEKGAPTADQAYSAGFSRPASTRQHSR